MDGHDDDLALLQRWRAGDLASGETLVRRHVDSIHRFFAAKGVHDVADLVQRTFLLCLERRDDARPIACFRAWLFGIARHLLLERWRGRAEFDPTTSSIAQLGPSASSLLVFAEEKRRLTQALWRIPLDDQIVLELYYWEGLGTAELAQVLDIAEPTARRQLQRARAAVSRQFEQSPGAQDDGPLEDWLAAVRPQVPRGVDR